MKQKQVTKQVAQILLSIVAVLSLVVGLLSVTLSVAFSPDRVNARLQQNGFYEFATEAVTKEVEALQSVIAVQTEDLQQVLPAEEIHSMLTPYVDQLNRQFLAGEQAPAPIDYLSDDLYRLVCDIITEEAYAGDTAQLTRDRLDAYSELSEAIVGTLNFFPQSLLERVVGKNMQTKLAPLYRAIGVARNLWLPALLVLMLSATGAFLLRRRETMDAWRGIAGTGFITVSALFVPALFIRLYSLPNRLSLTDGLLRRYILTVYSHMTGSLFTVMLVAFILSAAFLTVTVILSAKSAGTSCVDSADVLQ